MGRHSVSRGRKIAPTIVLGLSIFSVGSPLGLLFGRQEANAVGTVMSPDDATEDFTVPLLAARPSDSHRRPTATSAPTKAIVRSSTTTRPPTSRPTPAVSTRPRPTVAQRQIQRASTQPPTTQSRAALTTTTPKPQIVRHVPTQSIAASTTTSKPTATTTTASATEPPQRLISPSSSRGQRIVDVAKTYVGRNLPYRYGGDSLTTGIDCSHFIYRVFTEAGLKVSYRSSSALAAWTTRTSSPQPGDLVLYNGHAGIYAGNGMMVHHGRSGGAFFVKVYTQNLIGYGRIPS